MTYLAFLISGLKGYTLALPALRTKTLFLTWPMAIKLTRFIFSEIYAVVGARIF